MSNNLVFTKAEELEARVNKLKKEKAGLHRKSSEANKARIMAIKQEIMNLFADFAKWIEEVRARNTNKLEKLEKQLSASAQEEIDSLEGKISQLKNKMAQDAEDSSWLFNDEFATLEDVISMIRGECYDVFYGAVSDETRTEVEFLITECKQPEELIPLLDAIEFALVGKAGFNDTSIAATIISHCLSLEPDYSYAKLKAFQEKYPTILSRSVHHGEKIVLDAALVVAKNALTKGDGVKMLNFLLYNEFNLWKLSDDNSFLELIHKTIPKVGKSTLRRVYVRCDNSHIQANIRAKLRIILWKQISKFSGANKSDANNLKLYLLRYWFIFINFNGQHDLLERGLDQLGRIATKFDYVEWLLDPHILGEVGRYIGKRQILPIARKLAKTHRQKTYVEDVAIWLNKQRN
jgi:hypothetical protein